MISLMIGAAAEAKESYYISNCTTSQQRRWHKNHGEHGSKGEEESIMENTAACALYNHQGGSANRKTTAISNVTML